jgi:hypothetical protein
MTGCVQPKGEAKHRREPDEDGPDTPTTVRRARQAGRVGDLQKWQVIELG